MRHNLWRFSDWAVERAAARRRGETADAHHAAWSSAWLLRRRWLPFFEVRRRQLRDKRRYSAVGRRASLSRHLRLRWFVGLVVRRRRLRRGDEMGALLWERCRLQRGLLQRFRPYAIVLKKRRIDREVSRLVS